MVSPTTRRLNGIWGANSDDVYIVGDQHTVLKLTNDGWVRISGNDIGNGNAWKAISGFSSTDLVIVGDGGSILRWNGSTETLPVPIASGVTVALNDVTTSNDGSANVVGDDGVMLRVQETTATAVASGTTYNLVDNWSGNATLLAVGGERIQGVDSSAARERISGTWQALAGWNARGLPLAAVALPNSSVILSRASTDISPSVDIRTSGVWTFGAYRPASAITRFALVGNKVFGVAGNKIVIYDGTTWTTVTTGTTQTLNNIWAADECSVFAVGNTGTIVRR